MAPQSVASEDFPALYRAADELSANGQRAHLNANGWLLFLLMAGALVAAAGPAAELFQGESSVCNAPTTPFQQLLAGITVALMALSLWLTTALRSSQNAEAWHDGRALAESVKSMTWKYMMRVEPYGPLLSIHEADEIFCDDLRKLLTDARTHALPSSSAAGDQISDAMRAVRTLGVAERRELYVRARIKDQREWYARRSEDHGAASRRWFAISIGANAAALVFGIASLRWLPANGVVALATTAASCCLGWTQLQRYSALAHSYAGTSQEIGLLAPRASRAVDDDLLARFVADCESTFSREHTMWRARRKIVDS